MKTLLIALALLLAPVSAYAEITGIFSYPGGDDGDVQVNDGGLFGGRTLEAGTGVTISTDATSITINALGGSGASNLQIQEGGVEVSSPTVSVNFNGDDFDLTESPAGQANVGVSAKYLSTTTAAEVYLSTIAAEANYLTTSSATATYLQLSSATATYLQSSSATATYLQNSSATATYQPIGSYLTSETDPNAILNQDSLQSGATFFVSSGTVDGILTVTNESVDTANVLIKAHAPGTGAVTITPIIEFSGGDLSNAFGKRGSLSFSHYANGIRAFDFLNDADAIVFRVGLDESFGRHMAMFSTATQRFYDADSTHYVAWKASDTITDNVTWTLPAADGTSGQVIKTNGSGVLSWNNDETGGGSTEAAGTSGQVQFHSTVTAGEFAADSVFYWDNVNKRLGVGTSAPNIKIHASDGGSLHANTLSGTDPFLLTSGSGQNIITSILQASSDPSQRPILQFRKARGTTAAPSVLSNNDLIGSFSAGGYSGTSMIFSSQIDFEVDGSVTSTTLPQRISFLTGTTAANRAARLVINSNGNIGIGTSSPSSILQVVGEIKGSSVTVTGLPSEDCVGTDSNGTLIAGNCSGGGGSSALEVFSNFDGTRSSPTASIAIGDALSLSVTGSTAVVTVDFSSVASRGDVILKQDTLQSGATFYVSSGAVSGQLSVGSIKFSDGTIQVTSATAGGGGGDIEGVTAGYGLTGGGTSGTVTLNLATDSTSYIQNRNTLQEGATAYPDYLHVGSSATIYGPMRVGLKIGEGDGPDGQADFILPSVFSLMRIGAFDGQPTLRFLRDSGSTTEIAQLDTDSLRVLTTNPAGTVASVLGAEFIRGGLYIGPPSGPWETYLGDPKLLVNGNIQSSFGVIAATGAFSGDVTVSDEAYDATGWNGSTEVPTKNAVRDKIESLSLGGGGASSLAVTTGTASGFALVISSPTAVVNFSSTTFGVTLTEDATAFVSITSIPDSVLSANVSLLGSQIDIGSETNLAVTSPIILTDDTLSLAPISLSTGVTGSLPAASIAAGSLGASVIASSIALSGVTAGSYTNANITVAADGRLTAASNGSGGSGGDNLGNHTATETLKLAGFDITGISTMTTSTGRASIYVATNVLMGANIALPYRASNGTPQIVGATSAGVIDPNVGIEFVGTSGGGGGDIGFRQNNGLAMSIDSSKIEVNRVLEINSSYRLSFQNSDPHTTCISQTGDRLFHDTNCDGNKDTGEEFIDNTTGSGGSGTTISVEDGGTEVVATSTINFTGSQFQVTNDSGEALVALDGVCLENGTDCPSRETIISTFGVTVPISASSLAPTVTNGFTGDVQTGETSTNKVNFDYIALSSHTTNYFQFSYSMPDGWDGSTVTFKAVWNYSGGDQTDGVVFALQGLCRGDLEDIDTAYGSVATVTDAAYILSTDTHITGNSGALTLGGTCAAGDYTVWRGYRDYQHASDTLAGTARLLELRINYTRDSISD